MVFLGLSIKLVSGECVAPSRLHESRLTDVYAQQYLFEWSRYSCSFIHKYSASRGTTVLLKDHALTGQAVAVDI